MVKAKSSIIILAGGFGTRMKSSIPKVLHQICGKEMICCIIDEVQQISDDIHIVLYNQAESIKQILNERYPDCNFCFHLQDYEHFPGTAGAIMQGGDSKSLIHTKYNKILILSGDMPLVESAKLESFIHTKADIALGILHLDDASGYGRVIVENQKVKAVIEEKDANDEIKAIKNANAGIYCFDRSILERYLPTLDNQNKQNEFYLTDVISCAFSGKCDIVPIYGGLECFIGVNSKLDLSVAEHLMLERLRQKAMRNGVIMHIPQSIYIESSVKFIGECEIDSGVVIKGESIIENSHIKANSIIDNAYIKNSQVGPFARIRPQSNIFDCVIGNFVEVKASDLNGVKAGHLSYLGDSKIDSGTNVGAGVITCNYDGKAKHKTIIGKNVFIGSDSQLVAPLNIESNVIIASGSTVTRDIKDGELAISRVEQKNKSGFFYKFFGKKS